MKKKIIKHIISRGVPLPHENIDTDQIVPARFLKATTKEGFGKHLFYDLRHDEAGNKTDFILNNPVYSGEILIAGRNFGIGSSREHAAWALSDYGFAAVVSSHFADIFKNNAMNNSILPIQVNDEILNKLLDITHKNPETVIQIDLDKQIISVPEAKITYSFEINQYKKICLMNGYDDVDYLLSKKKETEEFEAASNAADVNL